MDIIIQKEGFEGKNISYEIDKVEIKSDILLNELEKGTKEKTRIFGTIRSSDKRDPVNNASITLSIEGTQIAAITSDELGGYEYTAEEDYTGQTLDFVIQKEGFLRKDISHEIDSFEIKSDFLMDEMEIKIEGKICDETDSPLDNASISFSIGNSTIDLVSDKDGYFSFTVGQQFLNQSIGYEVDKEGFKIKSGKLKLLENLKCINISKSIPPTVPDKTWIKNVVVGIGLIGLTVLVIYLFGLAGDPELTIDPDSMNFYFEPDTQAQELSIWNSEFSIWNFGRGTLEWYVYSDTDWIIISPDSGTDSGTVSVSVNSAGMDPGMYTGRVTVESNGGTETGRISLYIPEGDEPPEPSLEAPRIHYFRADPEQIDGPEGETILSWKVTDATSATIDGIGSVEVPEGSIDRLVEKTTTFILRATNEAGKSDVRTVTVIVDGETEDLPRIDSFTADPDSISAGEESTLRWKVSGATSVTIDGIGRVNSVGEIDVVPDETIIYFLRATNEAGILDVRTVKVTVDGENLNKPVIHAFSANPESISTGEKSTLQWNVSGVEIITINNGIGEKGGIGNTDVFLDETTIFILTAENDAGKNVKTVTVLVEKPELTLDPESPNLDFGIMDEDSTDSQTFSIVNNGAGILKWEIKDDQPWITVTPTSGTESGTVTVSVNTENIKSGDHTGKIIIRSNGGTKTLNIFLTVNDIKYVKYLASQEKNLIVPNGLCIDGKKNCIHVDGVSGGYYYAMVGDYVALNGNPEKLKKIKIDDEILLKHGVPYSISGDIELTAKEINVDTGKVLLTLTQDDSKLKSSDVKEGELFTYTEKQIEGESDVPMFVAYVETTFAGNNINIVKIRYVWSIIQ